MRPQTPLLGWFEFNAVSLAKYIIAVIHGEGFREFTDNVEIIVKNKGLGAGTYTVTFENKTIDEVLEGLQFSAHFQYQLKDGIVTIW